MYDYRPYREKYSQTVVGKTFDDPIHIAWIWNLNDFFYITADLFIFGVLANSFLLMLLSLLWHLIFNPLMRAKVEKGYLIHRTYYHFGLTFKGLYNPGTRRVFSD